MSVLTELCVARPVPLVFDGPSLSHQPEQCCGAGAQGCNEQMDVVKRFAVPLAGADQLDDPAGPHPALTDGIRGVACPELPMHLAAMAGLEIADLHWEVPVRVKLGRDLTEQPALVVLDRQEQVGALLGGELNNAGEVCSASAWISTPSRSSVFNRAFSAARSCDSPVSKDVWAIATPSSLADGGSGDSRCKPDVAARASSPPCHKKTGRGCGLQLRPALVAASSSNALANAATQLATQTEGGKSANKGNRARDGGGHGYSLGVDN